MSSSYIVDRGLVQGPPQARTARHHNINPALLIEKITRERIQDALYWKSHCFGLTAATLLDRVVYDVRYIDSNASLAGGAGRVSPFLCLLYKLVLLQPEPEIVQFYLTQPTFKYLTGLAAVYVRLFYAPVQVYTLLEPLLEDYRKLRVKHAGTTVELSYMDVFVDDLLTKERVCGLALPRLTSRQLLEDQDKLEPRESPLADELDSDSDFD